MTATTEDEEAQNVRGLVVQEDRRPLEGHDAAQRARDGAEEVAPGQARDHGVVDLEQRAIAFALGTARVTGRISIHRRPGPPGRILDPKYRRARQRPGPRCPAARP